jgi:hypothetical protein
MRVDLSTLLYFVVGRCSNSMLILPNIYLYKLCLFRASPGYIKFGNDSRIVQFVGIAAVNHALGRSFKICRQGYDEKINAIVKEEV